MAEITYSLEEGKRYTSEISTNVDEVFNKDIFELKDIYNSYVGEYYSPFKVKKTSRWNWYFDW